MFKNVFAISISVISYTVIGFNAHYRGDFNGWISFGSMIGDLNADGGDTFGYGGVGLAMTGFGDFIFQAMFAATAAMIVSGAVAERVKLSSFMIFATLLVAIAYPVVVPGTGRRLARRPQRRCRHKALCRICGGSRIWWICRSYLCDASWTPCRKVCRW